MEASKAVLECKRSLEPYLSVVAPEVKGFAEKLVVGNGVRGKFEVHDLQSLICRVWEERQDQELEADQERACLNALLLLIEDARRRGCSCCDWMHEVRVVTAGGKLAPGPECVFNDTPWLKDTASVIEGGGLQFVHEELGCDAHLFGAKPLRDELVRLGSEEFVVGEAFGQEEPLTTRLANLLREYPADVGIFKELVQNADDAGASRVVFVHDKRRHGSKSLIGQGMKAWQGPALCVYNDGVVSDDDLQSFQRLGNSKKKKAVGTIGKFGLGFNSVYHLTDVPSFVSGENAVWLDPHTSYVPGATRDGPGRRVRFAGEGHKVRVEQFEDQFSPFRMLGCSLEGRFEGTLFRFPLRDDARCKESKICNHKVDMGQLLSKLKDALPAMLMFLHNVEQVEVMTIEEGVKAEDAVPVLEYGARVEGMSERTRRLRGHVPRWLRSVKKEACEGEWGEQGGEGHEEWSEESKEHVRVGFEVTIVFEDSKGHDKPVQLKECWMVVNGAELVTGTDEEDFGDAAWGGVAAPLMSCERYVILCLVMSVCDFLFDPCMSFVQNDRGQE